MARRHIEQVWPGDNSSTNTKSWPPILGSPSNTSSIVGAFRDKCGSRKWKNLLNMCLRLGYSDHVSYRGPRPMYRPMYRSIHRSILDRVIGRYSIEYRSIRDRVSTDVSTDTSTDTPIGRYTWWFTDTSPILYRYFTDTSPILHWYFTDTLPSPNVLVYIGQYISWYIGSWYIVSVNISIDSIHSVHMSIDSI